MLAVELHPEAGEARRYCVSGAFRSSVRYSLKAKLPTTSACREAAF
jgi:hypothetical protein